MTPIGMRARVAEVVAVALAAGTAAGAAVVGLGQGADQQQNRIAVAGEIARLHDARRDLAAEAGSSQPTPSLIPQDQILSDDSGYIQSYQPAGGTITANNAFFQSLGKNGRTCFSCHQPDQGWSVSAAGVQARFTQTRGLDPIFRPVDGAVCPTADTGTMKARQSAYGLLLSQGLIRIGLPMPPGAQFIIAGVADPYGCNTNPATGLTSPTAGTISVYRRPLPSANLRFLTSVMWDGREGGLLPPKKAPANQPSLAADLGQQAVDATVGHAQGAAPTTAQVAQIVSFELGLSTAQVFDQAAGALNAGGASGGAGPLWKIPFFVGVNDSMGQNPTGGKFSNLVFNLYDAWSNAASGARAPAQAAVARGETLFNTRVIKITGVAGLNDVLGLPVLKGYCATCHDAPNTGNHSIQAPFNTGVAGGGQNAPPALNTASLPVFTVQCSIATAFTPANSQFQVTDLGRAAISGKCADVAKFAAPVLRGLAARAPYFHNGSAAGLADVINFYDTRFSMALTASQKADLIAYLKTL